MYVIFFHFLFIIPTIVTTPEVNPIKVKIEIKMIDPTFFQCLILYSLVFMYKIPILNKNYTWKNKGNYYRAEPTKYIDISSYFVI